MRQTEITIGSTYRVKIGGRLAPVTVLALRKRRAGLEKWQTVYDCRTQDTGRDIVATPARLRPMPGTPEAAACNARKLAAHNRRMTAPRPAAPQPAVEPRLVAPSAVAGMVERVDPSRLIEPLIGHNRDAVDRIVGGVHVAMPWSAACRAVWQVIGKGGRLRGFPKALRRGAWLRVADEHARNRRLYVETMGHAPIPSEEMVTAAMLAR